MSLSRRRDTEPGPKVEINIIPLVDIALVLLVIFMVTATFVKGAGLQLHLPTSAAGRPLAAENHELIIAVEADGRFLWDGQAVSDSRLAGALQREAQQGGTEARVTVRGDARAAHGRIVRAMTLAQQAGFAHLVIAVRQDVGRVR